MAHGMMFENVGYWEKYAEIGKFLYLQIVLKSSMLDVM